MLILLLALAISDTRIVIGVGERASVLQTLKSGDPNKAQMTDGVVYVVLTEVMSPGITQRYGAEAQHFAYDLTLGESVTIEPIRVAAGDPVRAAAGDADPTIFARVRVAKALLAEALLKAGLAWVTPNARGNKALVALEAEAKAQKRGLWADEAPMPPWQWRELQLLSDRNGKVLHAGWECPWVQETQCKSCAGPRFDGAAAARQDGYTLHDTCFTPELLKIAEASGGPDPTRTHARRACTQDSDCALEPFVPCTCAPCGEQLKRAARKDIVQRMTQSFKRALCAPIGCPACAGRLVGTRAVCEDAQCVAK